MAAAPDVQPAEPPSSSHGRLFLALWVGISLVATPLVAIFLGPAIPPGNGSAQASEQVFDNQVMVSICTPIFVLVVLFLGYALFAFRSRSAAIVDGPPIRGDSGIQLLWVVVTTIIVLFLAGFGTFELVQNGSGGGQGPDPVFVPSDHAKAIDVQVIAQQWEFTYRYPSYGGVETPHLMLPENSLIRLHVTSLDATHSFWAYELGVKADANAGVDNIVYVRVKGPRTFHIHCAELCGLWHGYMFDTGQIVAPDRFASWMKQQQAYYQPVARYLPPYSRAYLPDPQRRAG